MANIQWTSTSISNFFSTSLNQKNTGFNGLYSLLGDASLIRSGSYHKLMDSYYKNVKNQNTDSTSETTESAKTNSEDTKGTATEETKKEEIWDKLKTDTTLSTAYTNTGKAATNLDTSSILDTII